MIGFDSLQRLFRITASYERDNDTTLMAAQRSQDIFSSSMKLPEFSLGAPCHPHRQHPRHPEQDPERAVVATFLLRALERLPLNTQPP